RAAARSRAPRWRRTEMSAEQEARGPAADSGETGSALPGGGGTRGVPSLSSDGLAILGGDRPDIPVYGAPRPAVPERLPVTPRFAGCASGAGAGIGADAGAPGFRRLPEWLKVKLPGSGEYAETRALLKR